MTTTAIPRGRVLRPPADHNIARVDWDELGPEFYAKWGYPRGKFDPEHLTVYGPSGTGKSQFLGEVHTQRARLRGSAVVGVITKPYDKTLLSMGWKSGDSYPPGYKENPYLFLAKAKGISRESRLAQRAKVLALMHKLWRPGSNTVVWWDELPYIQNDLALKREVGTFYREGRALGLSNSGSLQRPAGSDRLVHSEAGWSVAFKPRDVDDATRVAEIFGDRALYRAVLMDLNRDTYEFVIKHEVSGQAYISHLPPPARAARRRR